MSGVKLIEGNRNSILKIWTNLFTIDVCDLIRLKKNSSSGLKAEKQLTVLIQFPYTNILSLISYLSICNGYNMQQTFFQIIITEIYKNKHDKVK
jgi:hypothetical protein